MNPITQFFWPELTITPDEQRSRAILAALDGAGIPHREELRSGHRDDQAPAPTLCYIHVKRRDWEEALYLIREI